MNACGTIPLGRDVIIACQWRWESACASANINDIFQINIQVSILQTLLSSAFAQSKEQWSFSGLFKNILSNVNIAMLLGDPKYAHAYSSEDIPPVMENLSLSARVLMGV